MKKIDIDTIIMFNISLSTLIMTIWAISMFVCWLLGTIK